jgi:hypothetical protein
MIFLRLWSVEYSRRASIEAVPAATLSGRKAPEKFCPRQLARNPLKRLDSDEEIQGFPRKSNVSLSAESPAFQAPANVSKFGKAAPLAARGAGQRPAASHRAAARSSPSPASTHAPAVPSA